jgi:hypothetical protein
MRSGGLAARVDEMSSHQDIDGRCAARARAVLGGEACDAAFVEAAGFGLDEVVRCALRKKPTTAASGSEMSRGATTRRMVSRATRRR